jgi:transcriptional regulator with XRE-family HTH domain
MSKFTRTPQQSAEEKAIRERFSRERPSREALIASGDIDPAESTAVADRIALRRAVLAMKAERERQGLSLADVSLKSGITAPALSKLENGRNPNPTVNTLARYARALGKEHRLSIGGESRQPSDPDLLRAIADAGWTELTQGESDALLVDFMRAVVHMKERNRPAIRKAIEEVLADRK